MFHLYVLLFVLTCSIKAKAQNEFPVPLQTGDLLFQNLDCGPLCDAIEEVTDGYQGHKFSHIGLVYLQEDTIFVIEAIGKDVHLTSLPRFLSRSSNKVFAGRLKEEYRNLIMPAIQYSMQQVGTPYDDAFIYDNGRYYCSELIYDAFKQANGKRSFFELQPMTFKQPGTDEFFPAWTDYYKELGVAIPETQPGINPGGISLSGKIEIIN